MKIAALLLLLVSSPALALSLGEGHILNHVGEPFVARVDLPGTFDPSVKFYPVKTAECRASLVGKTVNDCESLYDGALSLTTWRRSDGEYALKLVGTRADEMFYRVILKAVSAKGGVTYKSYDFLPEFKAEALVVTDGSALEVLVDSGSSAGKLGLVMTPTEEPAAVVQGKLAKPDKVMKPNVPKQHKAKLPRTAPLADVQPSVNKVSESRLVINKSLEFSDDIHALKNENVAIEAQIALLEKQIGLLKEVVRLKEQTGASGVGEAVVVKPAAPTPVIKPVVLPVQAPVQSGEFSWLTGLLLAVALGLLAVIGVLYTRLKRMNSPVLLETATAVPSATLNEMKSLDLTGVFVRPKW